MTAALAVALVFPTAIWAIGSAAIDCEMYCSTATRWFLLALFACPLMLTVTAVAGFKAFFAETADWAFGFTFIPALFVAAILASDFGYVSFAGLAF